MNDRIEAIVHETAEPLGIDVEAVELTGPGKHRVLRIAIDADGGVGIDTIASVSRDLSQALDATDVMGSLPYTLEVTSRGLDRPLELPRHWRRNAGRLVDVTLADDSQLTGRITLSDDQGVDLDVDGSMRRVVWNDITRALVRAELNPPKTTKKDA